MSPDGRVAVVVGGDAAFGRALSLALASDGCVVVDAGVPDVEHVVNEVRAAGGTAEAIEVDVTDAASTASMARTVIGRFGRIDVLVNGPNYDASAHRGPWTDIEPAEWDRCFSVVVRGVWLCCRAVAPYMRERRSGKIVNVGSTAPWTGTPGFLQFATAESALIGLTRSLARELGDHDIAVNMVCPDPVSSLDPESEVRGDARQQPFAYPRPALEGPVGPEALVGPVLFLAGSGSDFITGQSYLVNGGSWLQ